MVFKESERIKLLQLVLCAGNVLPAASVKKRFFWVEQRTNLKKIRNRFSHSITNHRTGREQDSIMTGVKRQESVKERENKRK